MNLFDQFEYDQKMLNELKSLFEFAPPAELRRSINDLLFAQLTSENPELPNRQELLSHVYYLLNFLEEVGRKP